MNILVIAPRFPYPPDRGGEITIYNFIKHLSERDTVSLICYYDSEQELVYLPELRRYARDVIPVRRHKKWALPVLFRWLLLGDCYMAARHSRRAMRLAISKKIAEESFDLLQVESFLLMGNIPTSTALPIVLDMHNVFYQIVMRMADSFYNPLVRLVARFEVRRTRLQEMASWRRATINVAVSEGDRDMLWQACGRNVPCEIVRPGAGTASRVQQGTVCPNRVLFVGSLHYHPNIDGLTYFVVEIAPLVRAKHPEVEFVVVGRDPKPEFVSFLEGHGIRVFANVKDLTPYLESAAVEVVPLRIGGGVRMKILEAMAAGKAVVTTAVGCEGLPVVDEQHLLVRNDPQSFAQAVVELLCNSQRRQLIEKNASVLGENELSWSKSITNLRAIHAQAHAAGR
jgi:glycosyltransferase involved in cell wall biosynthesis